MKEPSTKAVTYIMRGQVSIKKSIGAVVITFALGSCGDIPKPILTPAPANYRQLAADYFASLKPAPLGPSQARITITPVLISDIANSVPTQPGDWEACVKVSEGKIYAVFYADGKITDLRSAVGMDCKRASTFYPMPRPQAPTSGK
jgi:hypothetical protein